MANLLFTRGAQIWGGTGTASGDFTNGAGNAGLYDSATYKPASLCGGTPAAALAAPSAKAWAAPQVTGRARIFAPHDATFGNMSGAFAARFQIDDAGSIVDLCAPFNFTNNVVGRIIDLQATVQAPYTNARILLESATAAFMNIAQVQFFGGDVNGAGYGAPDAAGFFWWQVPAETWKAKFILLGGGAGGAGGNSNNGGGGAGSGGLGVDKRGLTPGDYVKIYPGKGGLRGIPDVNGYDGEDTTVDTGSATVRRATGGKGGYANGHSGGAGAGQDCNLLNAFGKVGGPAGPTHGGFGAPTNWGAGAEAGDAIGEVGVADGSGGAGGGKNKEGGSGASGSVRILTGEDIDSLM
jgi:hypothetical protein